MRKTAFALVMAFVVSIASPATVAAGPSEDAVTAYKLGDYATALRLFRPLAAQGNANAQYSLGVMYATGQGVAQDYAEAVKWWRLAAAQGLANAHYNLGVMYYKGNGVAQDFVQAHKWFNLAAARFTAAEAEDRDKAVKNRDIVVRIMTPAQIAEAQKLAREWKPKP